jgi:hypothetical protein
VSSCRSETRIVGRSDDEAVPQDASKTLNLLEMENGQGGGAMWNHPCRRMRPRDDRAPTLGCRPDGAAPGSISRGRSPLEHRACWAPSRCRTKTLFPRVVTLRRSEPIASARAITTLRPARPVLDFPVSSMASGDVGAEVRRNRALNCCPWLRSLTHSPVAVIHSPAAIVAE